MIYFTNLTSILKDGILSRNELIRREISFEDISNKFAVAASLLPGIVIIYRSTIYTVDTGTSIGTKATELL